MSYSQQLQQGDTSAKLQGEDFKTGAVAAGTRELISPLTANSSEKIQLATSQLAGVIAGGLSGGDSGASVGYNIATSAEIYNRQLHKDEIALQKTKNALKLKEVLAEISPNLSRENVNYLYEQTQKAMVDENGQKILDRIVEKARIQGMEQEVLTVINEAKQQILSDAKGNVYVDLQGKPTLVPMMDTNNYYDPRYYPSSTVQQNLNIFTSATLTTAGLVPNPIVSGTAWGVDTVRNIYNEPHDDVYDAAKNTYLPSALGFPANKSYIQKAGAGLSYYNLVESISNYNNQRKVLEWQKDQTNNQELVNIYSNPSQFTENIDKNIYNKANTISIKPTWLEDTQDAN
ncbi:hypothetical protein [Arcobacter sp. FWKO B]|uniref:hypothetical protein n=1 Tax=Arcobacter sp. FWKO B TaxID=2593672 RepID=UPI0018A4B259|nr:hypothetical protein [Arcobacter sp. FWKO B]QOG12449.1 hypothetical protein FWKOB_06930 [Arcobacter sp. FWKO B]